MDKRRLAGIAAVGWFALVAGVLAGVLPATPAGSHGSLQDPVSRSLGCYQEGPEAPESPACQAAVAAGGSQPLYDWNEVNLPNAAGNHRELVPDGKLCSAGRDKYRGLDLPRNDWAATAMTPGTEFTFRYRATAPHRGSFEFFLTRPGYDPTRPLRWADLDDTPFVRVVDPQLADGVYLIPGRLPADRTGRHLIYTIWQRSDSPEAFYTCSDVVFGAEPGPVPAPSGAMPTLEPILPAAPPEPPAIPAQAHTVSHPTDVPTSTATATSSRTTARPAPAGPAWATQTEYAVGDTVSHGGQVYRCRQPHISLPGWEPPNAPALWEAVAPTPTAAGDVPAWQPQTLYAVGYTVSHGGQVYRCRQAHMSLPGWEPPNVPALWEVG